ncbi:MAG TPA: histidine kinase [Cyclobacteriaceae bacterium]|nr:histidine kinase [Cyclobacteriaceae bacterium]
MFRKRHLLLWVGVYLIWVMVFQKRSFALSTTASIEFCYLLFVAANYYFNIGFIVPRLLYRQKYVEYILLFGLGVVITALLRVPLASFLNATYFFPGEPQPSLTAIFIASLLNIFVWTALLCAGKIAIDRYRLQKHVEEIQKEKSQAELDFLNAQLNPHFLFNSLNSIYGQIDKGNTSAKNMVLSFSEMLRYQLYDCNKNQIDIQQEIDYLKNYIALQQVRRGDRIKIDFSVADEVRNCFVAPLLFIAFVENAFKHVSIDEQENRIDISLQKHSDTLWFRCRNSKEDRSRGSIDHKGIGIENAKRRLSLHYGDKHQLKITNDCSYYEVDLKIQL